jgi:predicted nucleic acid-binding protein
MVLFDTNVILRYILQDNMDMAISVKNGICHDAISFAISS